LQLPRKKKLALILYSNRNWHQQYICII
jgi:hypothetical protein